MNADEDISMKTLFNAKEKERFFSFTMGPDGFK